MPPDSDASCQGFAGKGPAAGCRRDLSTNPAITYSRGGCHYHRPWMLNGRVRNGNGCDHPGMLTEKTPAPPEGGEYQLAAIRSCGLHGLRPRRRPDLAPDGGPALAVPP